MKRIIIIAAMALMSVSAFAQKLAYVDFNEIVMLMPEMDEARATLEENSKTNEEILMSMYEEYQTKMQQYEQKSSTWTPAVLETKQRELMEIESRLQQTQQSLQQELQQLQRAGGLFRSVHMRNLAAGEQNRGQGRNGHEDQGQPGPALVAGQQQKHRAKDHHTHNTQHINQYAYIQHTCTQSRRYGNCNAAQRSADKHFTCGKCCTWCGSRSVAIGT